MKCDSSGATSGQRQSYCSLGDVTIVELHTDASASGRRAGPSLSAQFPLIHRIPLAKRDWVFEPSLETTQAEGQGLCSLGRLPARDHPSGSPR